VNRILPLLICLWLIGVSFDLPARRDEIRSLRFYHTHTGQELDVVYFDNGSYRPDAVRQVNAFLADWRNGKAHRIDPKLLDILWEIQQVTGNSDRYEIISAYRSPETNALLRSRSKGVAKKSQHMEGRAIDVRLRGLDTRVLRDTALSLGKGGVGYYDKSDFVHIDTGRVRRW
jgi:uncharacterized protein YcbK (DUF882 family)